MIFENINYKYIWY